MTRDEYEKLLAKAELGHVFTRAEIKSLLVVADEHTRVMGLSCEGGPMTAAAHLKASGLFAATAATLESVSLRPGEYPEWRFTAHAVPALEGRITVAPDSGYTITESGDVTRVPPAGPTTVTVQVGSGFGGTATDAAKLGEVVGKAITDAKSKG